MLINQAQFGLRLLSLAFTIIVLVTSPWTLKLSFVKFLDAQTGGSRSLWFLFCLISLLSFAAQSWIIAAYIIKH